MFTRIFSGVTLLTLTACGQAGEDRVAAAAPDDRIECAVAGATQFEKTCTIERSADGRTLTLRHQHGGFRRLDLGADRTLTVTDGADEATGRTLPDGHTEIAVDGDRYRLPTGQ